MLEYLASLGSAASYGMVNPFSKKSMQEIGRHRTIVYSYVTMVCLFVIGAFFVMPEFAFPPELILEYVLQVSLGALGAIAAIKALDYGKSSITGPVGKTHVLLVMIMSIVLLGEELSQLQIGGAVLIVAATIVLGMDRHGELKPQKWMFYLGISIVCRAYYYTFIKTFVEALGPYGAAVALEIGIMVFVIGFHALRGRDITPPPAKKAILPAVAGSLVFLGSVFYSISVGTIGAALTAAVGAGAPMVNAIGSYMVLGEKLSMQKYAAIALMIIGLIAIFVL
jgi:transporter family protein